MGVKPTTSDHERPVLPRANSGHSGNVTRVKLRHGDRIDDRFTVMGRPLGRGGMGTVYKACDDHGVHYAIKRLHPALQEEKRFVTRFEREYEAASALRHPNIIAYQELFSSEGLLHIVMEFNDGINLRQLLKQEKQLPVALAASIARDLARALEHLHAHRVVHRDIKPENILLGRNGSVKLTDFGISRFEYSTITRTGTLLGTPRYMSPEQLAGRKGEDIGPSSDLYALGIVLYEMLTGKDPYRIQKKAEILEVINVKQTREAKPLPAEFDRGLQTLVMGLLEHDPSQRPQSAREVGQILGKWAAPRNVQQREFQDWLTHAGGARLTGTSTRKRDSFWQTEKTSLDPDHVPQPVSPASSSQVSLLPVFLLTLGFLLVLWGLGLWQSRPNLVKSDPHSPGTQQQSTPTSSSSRVDRAFRLQQKGKESRLAAPPQKEDRVVSPKRARRSQSIQKRNLQRRHRTAKKRSRKKRRYRTRRHTARGQTSSRQQRSGLLQEKKRVINHGWSEE